MFRGNTVGLLLAERDDPLYPDHGLCKPEMCIAKQKAEQDAELISFLKAGKVEDAHKTLMQQQKLASQDEEPKSRPEHYHSNMHDERDSCTVYDEVNGKSIAERVLEIVDAGRRPLFSRHPSGKLEIHDTAEGVSFTVFSHAWVDGFGNDQQSNFIYDCNLKLLDDLCRERPQGQNRYKLENDAPRFWIDSLGIPVGAGYEESRLRAVQGIHEIYAAAEETIVLDAGLLYGEFPQHPVQRAMRITMGNWIERLWTLVSFQRFESMVEF